MTETTSRFGWLACVALTAGTVVVGGWSPAPVSSTVTTTEVTPAPVMVTPAVPAVKVTRTTTTTEDVAPPVRQPVRHALKTAHRRGARPSDVVSEETTETTVVPAVPTTVTRTTETTTTR